MTKTNKSSLGATPEVVKISDLNRAPASEVQPNDLLVIDGTAVKAILAPIASDHYQTTGDWNSGQTSLSTPQELRVSIGGTLYSAPSSTLDLNQSGSWDQTSTKDYTDPANRAGDDFFIYAVQPSSGYDAGLLLSANSTFPEGYSADNSRKIGGFHCLCKSVGSISSHSLSGYATGDLLPASLWDLKHRANCIYLPSWDGEKMRSLYNAVIADGASSPSFMWYNFVELFASVGKQMISQEEFMSCSRGSNQQTDIQGNDPVRTGGHVDTAGRRMISDIGMEDCCGALWQWAREAAAETDQGSNWVQQSAGSYDSQNNIARGQGYEVPNRPLLGGYWRYGARCGSRCSSWNFSPLSLYSYISSRGVAEPRLNS
jgi:hypothetical protein